MNDKKIWSEEYAEFCKTEGETPALKKSREIKDQVQQLLNPSPLTVFLKVFRVVLLVGLLTLTICPQFGLGFVKDSHLFDIFMIFGHKVCKFFCGAFFLGLSLFVASLSLKAEDLKILRNYCLLEVLFLSVVCLSAFVAAGAKIFLSVVLFWLLGSVVGGILAVEAANLIVQKNLRQQINY